METETAWSPCIETYDFICKVFPSLTYYYRSEEPMMAEYLTNDMRGVISRRATMWMQSFQMEIMYRNILTVWKKPCNG